MILDTCTRPWLLLLQNAAQLRRQFRPPWVHGVGGPLSHCGTLVKRLEQFSLVRRFRKVPSKFPAALPDLDPASQVPPASGMRRWFAGLNRYFPGPRMLESREKLLNRSPGASQRVASSAAPPDAGTLGTFLQGANGQLLAGTPWNTREPRGPLATPLLSTMHTMCCE